MRKGYTRSKRVKKRRLFRDIFIAVLGSLLGVWRLKYRPSYRAIKYATYRATYWR